MFVRCTVVSRFRCTFNRDNSLLLFVGILLCQNEMKSYKGLLSLQDNCDKMKLSGYVGRHTDLFRLINTWSSSSASQRAWEKRRKAWKDHILQVRNKPKIVISHSTPLSVSLALSLCLSLPLWGLLLVSVLVKLRWRITLITCWYILLNFTT